ncbi:hypothetical protein [Ruegeria sp. PrR005]|uniref:Translation initiation factor 2 n=1 Tax=Ruegeria sp. PrR005 TaxID=2706882 RepID=A0A6B2NMJ4_9RHOB|nr:hypothetical protein [Ruegeria sp. PrR005]NDW45306.1 hypothetical protein [Ruegeria sp. PrR005]
MLDDPDLARSLGGLRDLALRLDPDLRCKLILPNDQIRYLTVDTGPFRGETRLNVIEDAVATATPYALDELVWDTSPDGSVTHVAAVARETLAEAEAFAGEHGFHPVSFVAVPDDNAFLGEPFFGPASGMLDMTGAEAVEPDGIAVVVIGPAVIPDSAPVAPLAESPRTEKAAPPKAETAAPVVGFSSRRGKPEESAAPGQPDTGDEQAKPEEPVPSPAQEVPAASPQESAGVSFQSVRASEPVVPAPPAKPNPGDVPARVKPAPVAPPAAPQVAARPIIEEVPPAGFTPAARPSQVPRDEADRLTIFGARKGGGIGGKPRFLGLSLTVGLLLFLAAIAVFAAVVGSGVLWDGSGRGEDPAPTLVTPSTDPATAASPEAPAPRPLPESLDNTPVPAPEPASIDEDPVQLSALQDPADRPALSGTDDAVLQALQVDPQQVEEMEFEPEPDTGTGQTETGILVAAPTAPEVPGLIGLGDLFVASIDRTDIFQDAVALPDGTRFDTDALPEGSNAPASVGQAFALDDKGLVDPSAEGTVNPDGILIFAGRPARVPPAPPVRFEAAPETDPAQERLAAKRPKARPDDLVEQAERSQFGGRSLTELAALRPKARPASVQEQAEAEQAAAPEDEPQAVSPLAVASAKKPRLRPERLAVAAAAANTNLGSLANPSRGAGSNSDSDGDGFVAATVKPKAPSPTSVARQATLDNAINLRNLNLIGVYGTPSNRRALVRLPSGRYKKVKVGDSIDGGRITAIGDSELRYQKGGRNLTLKIPSG